MKPFCVWVCEGGGGGGIKKNCKILFNLDVIKKFPYFFSNLGDL